MHVTSHFIFFGILVFFAYYFHSCFCCLTERTVLMMLPELKSET